MIEKNVLTDFSLRLSEPVIGSSTYVYPLKDMNKGVLHVNRDLACGYLAAVKK